jgi:hypothetical protein
MKPEERNKHNPFFIYGMVDPSEYDWVSQFKRLATNHDKDLEFFPRLDVGKVLGLATAYFHLLEELKKDE